MMNVLISRWGNSLGLRLPKSLAEQVGVRAGERVEMTVEGDALVLRPSAPRYVLADLLVNMTPQAAHEAFDWGDDVGREVIDD
jgi:antitoxin MazE